MIIIKAWDKGENVEMAEDNRVIEEKDLESYYTAPDDFAEVVLAFKTIARNAAAAADALAEAFYRAHGEAEIPVKEYVDGQDKLQKKAIRVYKSQGRFVYNRKYDVGYRNRKK